MSCLAGAGGTETPKLAVRADTSVMSEKVSLLTSTGQAFGRSERVELSRERERFTARG